MGCGCQINSIQRQGKYESDGSVKTAQASVAAGTHQVFRGRVKLARWTHTPQLSGEYIIAGENKQHGIYLWALFVRIRFLFYRFSQPGFVVGLVDK